MGRRRKRRKHATSGSGLRVGSVVRVKDGVRDSYLKVDFGGWHGRVAEIHTDSRKVLVRLDSISLREIPSQLIEEMEREGLDWSEIHLFVDDVELAEPRDTEEDVEKAIEEIESKHRWDWMALEYESIPEVLKGVSEDAEAFERWLKYLRENLKLPVEAEVVEPQYGDPLSIEDIVTITDFEGVEEENGILVRVKMEEKGTEHVLPLCDLEILNKESEDFTVVDAYSFWCANR